MNEHAARNAARIGVATWISSGLAASVVGVAWNTGHFVSSAPKLSVVDFALRMGVIGLGLGAVLTGIVVASTRFGAAAKDGSAFRRSADMIAVTLVPGWILIAAACGKSVMDYRAVLDESYGLGVYLLTMGVTFAAILFPLEQYLSVHSALGMAIARHRPSLATLERRRTFNVVTWMATLLAYGVLYYGANRVLDSFSQAFNDVFTKADHELSQREDGTVEVALHLKGFATSTVCVMIGDADASGFPELTEFEGAVFLVREDGSLIEARHPEKQLNCLPMTYERPKSIAGQRQLSIVLPRRVNVTHVGVYCAFLKSRGIVTLLSQNQYSVPVIRMAPCDDNNLILTLGEPI